ncbi:MAG: glutamate mutase L [Bacillota bacterium]
MGKKYRVLAGSIGDCVHSLGVETFAEWMEDRGKGFVAIKLGPAVPIQDCINKIRESRPEVVAISSRLGDLHVDKLIEEFVGKAWRHGIDPKHSGIRYCFGGLRTAANLVRAMTGKEVLEDKFTPEDQRNYDFKKIQEEYKKKPEFINFFELIVDDYITMEELEAFADGKTISTKKEIEWSDFLKERIKQVKELEDRPIIRAHIGIQSESMEPTIRDVEKVSDAGCVEIISLAPDQPCQAFLTKFIRGEEDPDRYLRGQGGAPIRTKEDLKALKEATKRGNFPLSRIYSGTDELVELAKTFEETLNMGFAAVPIFFYNELDGRGPISIEDSFQEHFDVIKWWAEQGKPLEINDPHQWQLRNCTDDMYVVDHILAGIIALKLGIKDYVMQLMFDLPPEIDPMYDLAKMKAAYEIIEPLTRHFEFNIIKETRGGLSSFPPNLDEAKGHLAMTTYWQMFMEPEIVHVVSFPEAHHEARAGDIIESCDIVKNIFKNFKRSVQPDIFGDSRVDARKKDLKQGAMYNILHLAVMGGYEGQVTFDNFYEWAVDVQEALTRKNPVDQEKHFENMLLDFINEENYPTKSCGLMTPDNLELALQVGLFQAPQITVIDKRYELVGKCRTKMLDGKCVIDEFDGIKIKDEFERVDIVRKRNPWYFYKNISQADEESSISELAEDIEEVVAEFRKQVGVTNFKDKKVLVVDFGSTFSKIGILDTGKDEFELKYVPTTVDDIREGLANGLGVLAECQKAGNWEPLAKKMNEFDIKLPCSSAKGGLKMVTVSLVEEESGFAANLASLTAGAKLLNSYAGKLSDEQAKYIYEEDQPEIILIAGGTNEGGDTATQLHNVEILAKHAENSKAYAKYGVPVIYAGNEDIQDKVGEIFSKAGVDVRFTSNVMPEVNTYNIEAVNETIRELFQTVIIRGKGFDVIEEFMDAKFIPTPRACFLGINLLAKGYGKEKGIGNIMALDIGGCTTDFYVNVLDNPLYDYPGKDPKKKVKRTILKTPNTPLAFRRVEGKYGMAYNAENLMDLEEYKTGELNKKLDNFFNQKFSDFQKGEDSFSAFVEEANGRFHIKLGELLKWIHKNPHMLPTTIAWSSVYAWFARQIMKIATENNTGYVKETETYFLQYGVNLFTEPCTTLLIGGTIYHKCKANTPEHIDELKLIVEGSLHDEQEPYTLRPNGQVLLDASYLISTVGGLYGRLDPEGALRIMKKYLKNIQDL